MSFDRNLYNKMLDDMKQEYINNSDWAKDFEESSKSKDKMKMLNLLIEKFNCEFDHALIITEHLIDKKPFPDEEIEKPVLTKEDREYIDKLTNKPKCQICGSTNIKRITTTEKVVNVAMFGLLGNKRKYQWHCNNCNSDF